MILCDERNPRARALCAELGPLLDDGALPDDLRVVVGGDGFMLRSAATEGLDCTYLGLNMGHLGFLLNDVEGVELAVLAAQILDGAWSEHAFPLIEARIELVAGGVVGARAINDIYLERSTGQAARLALSIDGHEVVEGLVADGLIFATALGSTAYSFSAGGPPCHPALEVIQVTPICPHLPRLSPFTLPSSAKARAEVRMPDRRPVRVVTDGRDIDGVAAVDVQQSDASVRIAYFEGHDFTQKMMQKIVQP